MKKTKVIILFMFLIIVSLLFILLNGNTYVLKLDTLSDNADDVIIEIDNDIVECTDKKIENGILKIKLKSKTEGKTFINIKNKEKKSSESHLVYVHKFGVITFNEYIGDCSGDIIIPISIIIFLSYILFILIQSLKKNIKENMYQYKNIAYLGMITFLFLTILSQLLGLTSYKGLINIVDNLLNLFSISIILFPITFIISIFVIFSNISLVKKEGICFKNILGIVLGLFLCFSTILPNLIYNLLHSIGQIDIYNEKSIGVYIYSLFETSIYIVVTYIECILIGTIVIGIKSARHIPKFNKDAIIILGCKIKNNGSLTNLLKSRVDRAIEFAKMQKKMTNKEIIFVPSGGKGKDEVISEAQAMKNYLLKKGINENYILTEDKAKNTYENILLSNNIINKKIKKAKIAFSTTNYHVFRAGCTASEQNLHFEGIGSKTKSYFWINAFIREFVATLYYERKKHLTVLLYIVSTAIVMILITYINNNI